MTNRQTTMSVVHPSVFFALLNAEPQCWKRCDSICHPKCETTPIFYFSVVSYRFFATTPLYIANEK